MFPIKKEYQEKFWIGKDSSYILYQDIINRKEKEIVEACQKYLDDYANGVRPKFSVDIDKAFERLDASEQETVKS